MIKSRLLRDIEQQQNEDDLLADFAAMLLDVLQIPEVVAAIKRAVGPAAEPPTRAPAARTTSRGRSRHG